MTRGRAILVGVVLFFAIGLFYAGENWYGWLAVLLADGVLAACWMAAAAAIGSVLLSATGLAPAAGTASTVAGEVASRNRPSPQPRLSPSHKKGTASVPTRAQTATTPPAGPKQSPTPSMALHFVTSAALGLGIFSIAALLLGLAGWLNRATAIALPAISLALFTGLRVRRLGRSAFDLAPAQAWLRQRAGWGMLWFAAVPFAAMVAVGAALPPGAMWHPTIDPAPYDILEYHLQVPREWYELGRIAPLHHNVFSFFPFNVEMQSLLAMHVMGGPWAGMYLAQYLTAACAVLAVLAVWGVAKELSPGKAPLGAIAAIAAPWTTLLAPVAYNEAGLLLYGTLAVGWALIALHRRTLWPMAIGGVMAGLACGVKLTAVPIVLAAVPAAILAVAFASRALRFRVQALACPPQDSLKAELRTGAEYLGITFGRVAIGCAVFVLAGLLAFSPWLIRNCVWAGNPVFPEAMNVLGSGHFTPEQVHRWEVEHSAHAGQRAISARLSAGASEILGAWQYGYILLPLAVVAAALTIRRPETQVLLLLLIALAVFWLGFTHLQSRFFVFGIPLAAMLIDQLNWRAMRGVMAATLVLAALFGWLAAPIHYGTKTQPMQAAGLSQLLLGAGRDFGVQDLSSMLPELLGPDVATEVLSGGPVALIGEAEVFVYQIPMSRLTYRTVFDVSRGSSPDLIEAWLGRPPRPDEVVVVVPPELRRFAETYAGIAPLPADIDQRPAPYIAAPRRP